VEGDPEVYDDQPDHAPHLGAALATRRRFIAGALATAGAVLVLPGGMAAARRAARALPAGDLFPLGVASGDPTASGIVLWTRLVAPSGTLGGADVAVDWELASDEAFDEVVAHGTAPAVAALGHSVHVEADGLTADTAYWYRFSVDGRTSPTGRTRTFPGRGVTPDRAAFALTSCQNWSDGYFTAHAALAEDDVDFVVFVGDYIYEKSADRPPRPLSMPTSVDVPTYRARYELYKGDAHLQAAHHRFPWIITMDDHEVANNVLGDLGPDGEDTTPEKKAAYLRRRADAFQVWYEHLPVRLPAPSGSSYRIHRIVEHSDLLRFYVLDGRQYRSPYPPGVTDSQGPDTPTRQAEDRTMLGADQETWLYDSFATNQSRWNAITQQTVFTAMPIPLGDLTFYNFDQWDGYPANRRRLVQALIDHRVTNPIVLSGDIHLAAAGGVRLDYPAPGGDDDGGQNVAEEIVTTSISSRFDPVLLDLVQAGLDAAPWVRWANARERGYARITVTPERWVTDFRIVDVSSDDATTATTDHTDTLEARAPVVPEAPAVPPTTAPATPTPRPTTAEPAPSLGGTPTYTG
jgi:alkaline phosphatase D